MKKDDLSNSSSKSKTITAAEILMMSKSIVAASARGHTATMDTIDRINAHKTATATTTTTHEHDKKTMMKKDRKMSSPDNKDRNRYPKSQMKSPKAHHQHDHQEDHHHQQQQHHKEPSAMTSVDVGSLVGDVRIAFL